MNPDNPPPQLPDYTHGVPGMEYSQQKPLLKMLGKMLAPKFRPKKGIAHSQTIKIKQKKVRYW